MLFSPLRLVFFLLAVALAGSSIVHAQSARWEPSGGSLAVDQQTAIQLIFENCRPTSQPVVPKVDRLELSATDQTGSSMEIVNGQVTAMTMMVYVARPLSKTPVTIPSFTVETDKGPVTVPAVTFMVTTATVGQSSLSVDAVSNGRFVLPQSVWAGEVFPVVYNLSTLKRYYGDVRHFEWDPSPIVAEALGQAQPSQKMENGEQWVVLSAGSRGYIKTPGDHTVNQATASVLLVTGATSSLFSQRPNYEQFLIRSNRPQITVKPLPTNAPPSFGGAVGQFKVESNVVPASVAVGEPVTWTVTLTGIGNWPDVVSLPSREVSKDFRVVQPQAKRTIKTGTLFDGTLSEDIVLVPTRAGSYTLGPFSWSYFDPAKGGYQTVSTAPVTVSVSATSPPANPGAPSADAPSTAAAAGTRPQLPERPAALPTDPLDSSGLALRPFEGRTLALLSAAPFAAVLLFWICLALRRAKRTDPLREIREARARLVSTLAELSRANGSASVAGPLLRRWQHDTGILWRLPHAAPSPQAFRSAAGSDDAAGADEWIRLWEESERALYRDQTALPSDWIPRAEAALAAKIVPGFSTFALFRPKNLLPFAAVALASITILATDGFSAAADARLAYRKGDFAAAEQGWRAAVAKTPNDWSVRHNLALALAQQNRWGEAAAHATAAFVQQPRNELVQRNLAFVLQKAGYTSTLSAPPPQRWSQVAIARQLSPPGWQVMLIAASAVFCLGIAGFLASAYAGHSGRFHVIGIVLCSFGFLAATTSGFALVVYSPAHDVRTALVWRPATLASIPTEVDSTQKTTKLDPGSVAIVDKTFLGWSRLAFPDGQTGWVRQEHLVYLWK